MNNHVFFPRQRGAHFSYYVLVGLDIIQRAKSNKEKCAVYAILWKNEQRIYRLT